MKHQIVLGMIIGPALLLVMPRIPELAQATEVIGPPVEQVVEQVEEPAPAPEPEPIKGKAEPEVKKPVVKKTAAPKPAPVGCKHYAAEVQKYNWNADVALAVMKAESSCKPTAVGDDYVIGGIHAPSCGLMQVRTLAGRPTCTQLKDPVTNIKAAYAVYQAQGWSGWSVCNKGIVRC